MKKLTRFLAEHALVLVISAIALVSVILIIIVFTLASSGGSARKLVIEEITGNAFILKNDGQIPAVKNKSLESGDVIITSAEGTVKLAADKNKYIYIEPETTLYVYYTDVADKGSIVVNISEGAAICRLDSKLPKNSAFEVRTPNSVVSAAGTVFRTKFEYFDAYGGFSEVKLTEVECAQGSVNIQLYDNDVSPADQLMLLAEGKSARLMTCAEAARFEYLNSDTDIYSLSEEAVKSYIRIAAEREISYSQADLNSVYQSRLTGMTRPQETETAPPVTEPVTESMTETFSTASVTETTRPTETTADTAPMTPSETTSETDSQSPESAETSAQTSPVPETTSETGTTPISVPETTTRVYNVTTTAPAETVPAVTEPPAATSEITAQTAAPAMTEPTAATTVPPIKPAVPVTTKAPAPTTPAETASPETSAETRKTTVSTVPWWEIINSSALGQ